MGKPAARMGDMTAHGGVIVAGCPTVLIGGQPAARIGDMHTCPIPGAPPPPHVGGPILLGSSGVMIGGMPAARVGDTCQCVGPPDSILPPGCPTVLIGETGGGGGGGAGGASGGGGSQAQAGSGTGQSVEPAGMEGESDEKESESHYLDVKLVDQGGKPIMGVDYDLNAPDNNIDEGTAFGTVRKTGVKSGDHEIQLKAITKAEWSVKEAKVGDTVTLLASVAGFESGTPAIIEIYQRDCNRDTKVRTFRDVTVQGDRIEREWEYEYLEDTGESTQGGSSKGFSWPQHYFTVQIGKCRARSPMLRYQDWIEIRLKDDAGNVVPNEDFVLYLANGEVRRGTLDGDGFKKVEKVPPGGFRVRFPNLSDVGPED